MLTMDQVQSVMGIAMTTSCEQLEALAHQKVDDVGKTFHFVSAKLHRMKACYSKDVITLSYYVSAAIKPENALNIVDREILHPLEMRILFNAEAKILGISIIGLSQTELM